MGFVVFLFYSYFYCSGIRLDVVMSLEWSGLLKVSLLKV